ncbi:MAG: hypothetical protein JSV84_11520 [Gemmatimonadota bacterium]|nr:MAG: hypothetical protein JSV84_11520 [Gemmatimonadota bacterium]
MQAEVSNSLRDYDFLVILGPRHCAEPAPSLYSGQVLNERRVRATDASTRRIYPERDSGSGQNDNSWKLVWEKRAAVAESCEGHLNPERTALRAGG